MYQRFFEMIIDFELLVELPLIKLELFFMIIVHSTTQIFFVIFFMAMLTEL